MKGAGRHRLTALPLPETSLCQPQSLPCQPGRPCQAHLPTLEENVPLPGAEGLFIPRWALGAGGGPGTHIPRPGRMAKPLGSRACSFTYYTFTCPKRVIIINIIIFHSPFHPPSDALFLPALLSASGRRVNCWFYSY